jgi:hypothetical protein
MIEKRSSPVPFFKKSSSLPRNPLEIINVKIYEAGSGLREANLPKNDLYFACKKGVAVTPLNWPLFSFEY